MHDTRERSALASSVVAADFFFVSVVCIVSPHRFLPIGQRKSTADCKSGRIVFCNISFCVDSLLNASVATTTNSRSYGLTEIAVVQNTVVAGSRGCHHFHSNTFLLENCVNYSLKYKIIYAEKVLVLHLLERCQLQ